MFKPIIRLLAFFSKEINEIRRQPRLVLSLILGPFLILLLFGAGYQGDRPLLKTSLVVPPEMLNTAVLNDMTHAIQANFQIQNVGTDATVAVDTLVKGQVDVVEIIPPNIEKTAADGKQSQVEFKYNEINPLTEQWVQYLGYAQVTELNKTILRTQIDALKKQAEKASAENPNPELKTLTAQLTKVPSDVLVSPLQQTYQNVYGSPPNFMFYYAPSVLALIVQHIAVTLGALSLVREKLLGAIEFYGVAPVWLTQVLIGKYMAYTLFIAIVLAVLIGLMLTLGIPFVGSIATFAGISVLFVLASLGVGFLISALSSTDSQAVQLSMLVLLLSIFFSGFFLPLENFSQYIRPIGLLIPLTFGIESFQDIMLRGRAPSELVWIALGAIALVTFVLVQLIWRRQFRQIA